MMKRVQIFFSFSNEDPTALKLARDWKDHLMKAAAETYAAQGLIDLYLWMDEGPGRTWTTCQSNFISSGDLFIPFITPDYLTDDSSKPRFAELDLALKQFGEKKVDIAPVLVHRPPDALLETPNVRGHWDGLKGQTFLLALCEQGSNRQPIEQVIDLPEEERSHIPTPILDWFFKKLDAQSDKGYIDLQYGWINSSGTDVRPILKRSEELRKRAEDWNQSHTEGPLGKAIRDRSGISDLNYLAIPDIVRRWQGFGNTNDPAIKVSIDLLIMFLERKPTESAATEWLEQHLPSTAHLNV